MKPRTRAIMAIVSLGLIAIGAGWIYPPLAPLALGCLLWYDLATDAHNRYAASRQAANPRSGTSGGGSEP